MKLYDELVARGLIAQVTNEDEIREMIDNGITTNFGADYNTLIVHNLDTPGHVAAVTGCLSDHAINIATMQLYRSTAGGYAVMVLECDQPIPDEVIAELRQKPGIVKVTSLNL